METQVILYIDRTINERGLRIAKRLQQRLNTSGVESRIKAINGVEGIVEKLQEDETPSIGVAGRNSCAFAQIIPPASYLGRIYGKVIVGNPAASAYFRAYDAYFQQKSKEDSEIWIRRANHRAGLF